ncbi:hypothetical protein IW261DRAFT_1487405 [Armillaria novae-zelandiae]|uniref:Uncharacterized protein n=1 Tax=Armillaria novae-zelandiae TaxID=153914 RepID=A0AA39UG28_9AGAR|nr:hypothetical protein IW261DRAFT_1487405 [Armillaria novae-zelandiae]
MAAAATIIDGGTAISTSIQSFITVTVTNTVPETPSLSTPSSLQTSSSNSHRKATPAVIAASVLGAVVAVIIVIILFVLRHRRRHSRNHVDNDSVTDNDPRRLSQSSRTAYEDEIERLRQLIMFIDEEMNFSSAPPSYHTSRSGIDVSDAFGRSSSLLPPVPPHEIHHTRSPTDAISDPLC